MTDRYTAARKAAEKMEGKCESPPDADYWCSWHDSRWGAGLAVCDTMNGFIMLAEQGIEEAEPIIRADERAKHPGIFDVIMGSCGHTWLASQGKVPGGCPTCFDVDCKVAALRRAAVTDLRAKVKGLRTARIAAGVWDGDGHPSLEVMDRWDGEPVVLLADVLALFPKEASDE